jgi:hypothetical protein
MDMSIRSNSSFSTVAHPTSPYQWLSDACYAEGMNIMKMSNGETRKVVEK